MEVSFKTVFGVSRFLLGTPNLAKDELDYDIKFCL